MLKRITSWSFQHRRLVVAAWIGVLVAINFAAMAFGGENKQDFLSPGTDSKAAIELLDERFPAQAGDTVTIVIHDDAGVTSPGVLAVAEPLVERVRQLPAHRRASPRRGIRAAANRSRATGRPATRPSNSTAPAPVSRSASRPR